MRKALVIEEAPELRGFLVAAFEYLQFDAYSVETMMDATDILSADGWSADGEFEAVFINTCEESRVAAFDLATLIAERFPAIRIFIAADRLDRPLHELPPCVFLAKPLNARMVVPIIKYAFRTHAPNG